ncbi:transposase family protein [Streptomyces sp. NPDC000133]|uniref:transposase family protein n=1 Tax=Streptomyces sp. NPDC000133 TaxID=3364535 RepID=UPI0036D20418
MACLPPCVSTGDIAALRRFLGLVPDPRKRRGLRYTAITLLTTAAVLAGSRPLAAVGAWIADAPQQVRVPLLRSDCLPTRSPATARHRTPPPSAAFSSGSTGTHWAPRSAPTYRPEPSRSQACGAYDGR